MKNLLLKIDFLSLSPMLNTFNMKRYQNGIGAFLSLLTLLIMGAFSIYFSYHTFSRQRVNININVEQNIKPTPINFSENPIVMWIYNSQGTMICDFEEYINIKLVMLELNTTTNNLMPSVKQLAKN